ncbi:MAG: type II toxin-antitoxin system HicA family toxin [Verrucomicrobia bacterium]|nr:type II toxin-antitoxin system HicA family toxin [Verrucomicrobiota bacterium]
MSTRIRDITRRVADDVWKLVRTRGSHRHFKHPSKPGLGTIAGHPGVDMLKGTIICALDSASVQLGHGWNTE